MYILMNKDREVARFSLPSSILDETKFIKHTDEPLPIGFKYIQSWIENRKATKHNDHLKAIMRDCGCDTAEGFIRVTHAATINDTFWVKNENEEIAWNDVSFYRNDFDETISRLAFEGVGLYGIELSDTSPELSTSGSFRKCWMREAGDIYLYKRGSFGAANAGMEPYCEMMASELAGYLTDYAVKYRLVKLHGELASKCLLFTDEKYGYAPISKFDINFGEPGVLLRFFDKLGEGDTFQRMIIIDALTLNIDRHTGNYGVIFDNDTLQPVKMAPIFDMNMSLMPRSMKEDYVDPGRTLLEYSPCIGDDFVRMGQEVMTPAIRSDLINLKGFEFAFRGDDVFPEWRVKALDKIVNTLIDALLCKDRLYTKDVFVPGSPV